MHANRCSSVGPVYNMHRFRYCRLKCLDISGDLNAIANDFVGVRQSARKLMSKCVSREYGTDTSLLPQCVFLALTHWYNEIPICTLMKIILNAVAEKYNAIGFSLQRNYPCFLVGLLLQNNGNINHLHLQVYSVTRNWLSVGFKFSMSINILSQRVRIK